MIHLFREALAVQRTLAERGWGLRFCFIGGVALQHWGEPRVTRDLDLSLFTGFGGEAEVVDELLGRYWHRKTAWARAGLAGDRRTADAARRGEGRAGYPRSGRRPAA